MRRGWRRSRPFRACALEPPDAEFLVQLQAYSAVGGENAGEDGFGDPRQRHAKLKRVLRRPAAGALLLRLIDDDVDQRFARGRVGLSQDSCGDLDQIAVEVTLFPGLEDICHGRRVEAVNAFHEIVGFGYELHVGIFDAIVHHLDVVACALRADICTAGHPIDLGRHLGQHRRDAIPGFAVAAWHHARTLERALLTTGNAHADKADLFLLASLVAPRGVGEQRVAAVDNDVAFLKMRQELVDHLVDRLAGLDHDEDWAGFCDAGDELGQLFGREKSTLFAVFGDQRVGALVIAIEDRNAEPLVSRVPGQVCAHDGQSHNANVCFVSHGFSALFGGKSPLLAPRRGASKSVVLFSRESPGNASLSRSAR